MQAVANFFVDQARQSTQQFANATEVAARLIYNYDAHGPMGDSYQAYVFPPSSKQKQQQQQQQQQ